MRSNVIAFGNEIILRDPLPSDADRRIYWRTHGEWIKYDAPWEFDATPMTEVKERELRERLIEQCAVENLSTPRFRAIISSKENKPLGRVSRYFQKKEYFKDTWLVGIGIYEDEYLNKGIGTEALRLWINYLFSTSNVHRIGLDTWSFNKRMIRVAEKIGFVFEGAEREIIHWKGEWLDAIHFGILRNEWEDRGTG
jgi:RimJ/RimL family protein N-acetyltransferase